MDINAIVNTILAVCSGVTVIAVAISWVIRGLKPIKTNKEQIANIEKELESHEKKLENDFNRMAEIEDTNKMICKCLLSMLDHEITGNGIDKMKKVRKEMQDFLIDK